LLTRTFFIIVARCDAGIVASEIGVVQIQDKRTTQEAAYRVESQDDVEVTCG